VFVQFYQFEVLNLCGVADILVVIALAPDNFLENWLEFFMSVRDNGELQHGLHPCWPRAMVETMPGVKMTIASYR